MPQHRITFTLSSAISEQEAEQLAAELAEEAREHLLDGEALELHGVTAAVRAPHGLLGRLVARKCGLCRGKRLNTFLAGAGATFLAVPMQPRLTPKRAARKARIREAERLRASGLSFKRIGDEIGVTATTVQKWLSADKARRYAAATTAWREQHPERVRAYKTAEWLEKRAQRKAAA